MFFCETNKIISRKIELKIRIAKSICSFTILGPKLCIWLRLVIQYHKVVVKIVAYDWRGRGPGDEGAGN